MRIKSVLIAAIGDTGNEPEALRQVLEYFGVFVGVKRIGRPKDLIEVLKGTLPFAADCVILSCHGVDGKIVMPGLADAVYEKGEPRGDFSASEVKRSIRLSGKIIVNTGCTTGMEELAGAFSDRNLYIAPKGEIEGKSDLFFIVKFFYEILQNGKPVYEAFLSAKGTDEETDLFQYSESGH